MSETQKIKRFGLPLSKPCKLLGRVAAKADQSGLVRVQRQFELAQSLVQILQKGLCLMLVLETNDLIVGKAYDDHVAVRLGVAPSLDPQIVPVMQIDARSQVYFEGAVLIEDILMRRP